ncbi:MAG: TetR/AcrR family transcriptional regulator [Gammaproteobacteria bacterium]
MGFGKLMTVGTAAGSRTIQSSQLRNLIDLLLSDEMARIQSIPINHPRESLSRSPAKVEILLNSLLVFIERGITEVTVQDLLNAAGISRRTFYKYFRNKIDVLESLYKLAVDVMVVRFKMRASQAQTIDEAAVGWVDVSFEYHRDLGPVIRMMQEEAIRSESPLAPHRRQAQGVVVEIMNEELLRISGQSVDPLALKALLWLMESASMELLREGVARADHLAHWRQVMIDMTSAVFARALDQGARRSG